MTDKRDASTGHGLIEALDLLEECMSPPNIVEREELQRRIRALLSRYGREPREEQGDGEG